MRTLTLRGLVEEAGTEHETGAILYRTTGYFLERLGLAGLDELPDLAPFLPDEIEDIDGAEEGIPGTSRAQDTDSPRDTGRSQDTGRAQDTDSPRDTGRSQDTGRAQDTGRSQDTGTPQGPQGAGDAGDEHPGQ
jgi:hypothetical protein